MGTWQPTALTKVLSFLNTSSLFQALHPLRLGLFFGGRHHSNESPRKGDRDSFDKFLSFQFAALLIVIKRPASLCSTVGKLLDQFAPSITRSSKPGWKEGASEEAAAGFPIFKKKCSSFFFGAASLFFSLSSSLAISVGISGVNYTLYAGRFVMKMNPCLSGLPVDANLSVLSLDKKKTTKKQCATVIDTLFAIGPIHIDERKQSTKQHKKYFYKSICDN